MRERFWKTLCAGLPAFVLMFALDIVLLVLLVASIPYLQAGSDTYYITLVSGVLLVVVLVGSGFIIRRCRSLEYEADEDA